MKSVRSLIIRTNFVPFLWDELTSGIEDKIRTTIYYEIMGFELVNIMIRPFS